MLGGDLSETRPGQVEAHTLKQFACHEATEFAWPLDVRRASIVGDNLGLTFDEISRRFHALRSSPCHNHSFAILLSPLLFCHVDPGILLPPPSVSSPLPLLSPAYLATAAVKTCVLKKPPLVRSMTCWYTELGGWFMTTVPSL